MHRDGHPALGRPFQYFVKLSLVVIAWLGVVVHAPSYPFAQAIELQHVVAKALRQHLRQTLQLLELLAFSGSA